MIHPLSVNLNHPFHLLFPQIHFSHVPLWIRNECICSRNSFNNTAVIISDTTSHFSQINRVTIDDVVSRADGPQANILISNCDKTRLERLWVDEMKRFYVKGGDLFEDDRLLGYNWDDFALKFIQPHNNDIGVLIHK